MTSLNGKIREAVQYFRDTLPPELYGPIEQGAGEISAMGIIDNALAEGEMAPDFDLPRYGGGIGSLSGYLEKGPVVLTFYRGIWCPYCNLQLKEYDDRLSEITDLGATLVAVTPERPNAIDLMKTAGVPDDVIAGATPSVKFDVLHDQDSKLASLYGLVFELPEAHRHVLSQIGIDLTVLTGSDTYAFADPATYVIGQDRTIMRAFVPNNYRRRTEVDAIKKALIAMRD
ncbi:MAG: peroxiredoxin-like family protein [Alphaproteobacteria bacterium]|uniref:peroxiredoxin-like family protein n=1 Tax=Pacificispira sp. TaxID=2888761 RepID=UPI0032F92735